MSKEKDIINIINEFMNKASPSEINELQRLLKERKNKQPANINNIARQMATQIQEQMGLTTSKIKETARDVVRQMILQYDPFISEQKLNALIDAFVSRESGPSPVKALPPEILLSMISQFVSYSMGTMPAHEKRELPPGWEQKYWENFPEEVQRAIAALIKNEISEGNFWRRIEQIIS